MRNYQPRFRKNNDGSYFALIVRIDNDGQENVIHGYRGRHFSTLKAAERSTENYITKNNLNQSQV